MSDYVTLLSDSSSHGLNLHNFPYSFRTTFSDAIPTNGVGKLGLYEISFSTAIESDTDLTSVFEIWSWVVPRYRIENHKKILTGYGRKIFVTDSTLPLPKPKKDEVNGNIWIRLNAENLSTPESLIAAINGIIYNNYDDLKSAKKPLLSYDADMQKCWFNWPSTEKLFLSFKIKGRFLYTIGVCDHLLPLAIDEINIGANKHGSSFFYKNKTLKFNADFLEDINSQCDFRNFFAFKPHVRPKISDLLIYADVISESRVGNAKVNLLKWIEFDTTQPVRRYCINYANSMQYFSVTKEQIDSVVIEIKSKFGQYIKLVEPVRIVLHCLHP